MLNLDGMPDDPISRLVWLNGVQEQVDRELEPLWRRAYFDSRLQQRFGYALSLGFHSKKRALAMTRYENRMRGQGIRWGDDFDPTSGRKV